MLDQGKINASQLGLLSISAEASTASLFLPAVLANTAGHDGWIAILFLSTAFGLLVVWVCTSLGLRFPKESIVQYSQKVLGRFLGRLVGLSYFFYFIWVASFIVREFGALMTTAFMPETPILVFVGLIVALGGYAVKNGLEVIARASLWMFPLLLLSYLAIIVLAANEIELINFLPVLEEGVKPVIKASALSSAWRGEIVHLLILLPNLNHPPESRKAGIYAVIFLGIVLTVNFIAVIGVFGAELTSRLFIPFLSLTRYGQLGMLLQRMESLAMVIWVGAIMIKVAVFYYCAVLSLAQCFDLRDYKPLVAPVGIIIIAWSLAQFENFVQLMEIIANTWPSYAPTLQLAVPALVLAVAVIRKKGESSP